ncbi:MAG: hypothetical protein AB7J63_13350 [Vicinamibacterales bacterium]
MPDHLIPRPVVVPPGGVEPVGLPVIERQPESAMVFANADPPHRCGVYGYSPENIGVYGKSESHNGVWADTTNPEKAALRARNLGGGWAGAFEGHVHVTGRLRVDEDILLTNGDCAEDFDVADPALAEPGTVMVFGCEGRLVPSATQYDARVAGVVAGAGKFRPALVLDRQTPRGLRAPIALMGKVYCKVDADLGAIEPGDLLTTSPTSGHAMRVSDVARAHGATIGKAITGFARGRGLIPILVQR